MYTFCFVQARSSEEAVRLGTNAVSAVRAQLPALGSPSRVASHALVDVDAAFVTLLPERDVDPSLIQHAITPDVAVLSWGALPGVAGVASAVREAFIAAGIEGVARLEGNLSAVVVDRRERRIWVAGTLLGHRALFTHADGDSFVASPHDLTLLATGRVPFELDPDTLASMAATDWSLAGRSLLAGVRRCHPLEAIRHDVGRRDAARRDASATRSVPVSHWDAGQRVSVRDSRGIRRQIDRVLDGIVGSVERHVGGSERVLCALTAGMDSRAVFAAICGAKGGGSIIAATSGGESNQDVVVARRLARLVGAEHRRQEPEPPQLDDFLGSARLRAFFCSGDTNAKRALTSLPTIDASREWMAGGNGGEIYRGFFYQYFGLTGAAPRGKDALAERLLGWRFRRLAKLPFADPRFAGSVRERLFEALAWTERFSRDPYDMADLLYLFERYGRWGAAPASFPWQRSWTPFESVSAIREAFCLPSPIGTRCAIHTELIRRYLPAPAYWTPINGGQLLALDGGGRLRYALRQALNGTSVVVQRARRRLSKGAQRGDDIKTEFLAGPIGALAREQLLEAGSLSQQVFGRAGAEQLLARGEREGFGCSAS
ncbi:MAG TPA: hypothetical protein VMG12_24600 [Polyangiaceae bacterium]|nr:hypothetical protein [Polyangiaceae bacterium]